MTTTNNAAPFRFTILHSASVRDDGFGRTLHNVILRLDDIAAPGCDWTDESPRRVVELSSFDGNPVDVYVQGTDGIHYPQGRINDYAPNSHRGGCSITATFRKAWNKVQRSKRARAAFEASCERAV